MVHGGVGTHGQTEDGFCRDAGGFAQVCHDGNQSFLDDGILKLLFAAAPALLDDAVDDVGTVADLAVAGGALGQELAGFQVRQDHGDGGGADVDGTAYDDGVIGCGDFHALEFGFCLAALDADVEIVCAEGGGQLHHDGEGDVDLFDTGGGLDGPDQTFNVGHGVIQGGCFHGNIDGTVGIFKNDAAFLQLSLAILENGDFLGRAQVSGLHAALVSAGDVGDENGAVAHNFGVAGQTPAGIIFLGGDMAGGDGFNLALNELHAAFAAGAVAGTGGIDGHVGAASQFQQVITGVTFNLNRGRALNLEGYFHQNSFLSSMVEGADGISASINCNSDLHTTLRDFPECSAKWRCNLLRFL